MDGVEERRMHRNVGNPLAVDIDSKAIAQCFEVRGARLAYAADSVAHGVSPRYRSIAIKSGDRR